MKRLILCGLLLFTPLIMANDSFAEKKLLISIYKGSLKQNIERIASYFGYKTVVWELNTDYNWITNTQLKANTRQEIFTQVLSGYPVKAVFYQGNRVLAIRPRNA